MSWSSRPRTAWRRWSGEPLPLPGSASVEWSGELLHSPSADQGGRVRTMPKRHDCSHFIPLATGELVDLLGSDRTLTDDQRDGFCALCERVQLAYHLEYHGRLRELKAAYAPFDPDGEPALRALP